MVLFRKRHCKDIYLIFLSVFLSQFFNFFFHNVSFSPATRFASLRRFHTHISHYAVLSNTLYLSFSLLYTNKQWVNLLLFISLVFFCVEMTLLSIAEKGYFNSFFFWLDFLGSVSLVFDIPWLVRVVYTLNIHTYSLFLNIHTHSLFLIHMYIYV